MNFHQIIMCLTVTIVHAQYYDKNQGLHNTRINSNTAPYSYNIEYIDKTQKGGYGYKIQVQGEEPINSKPSSTLKYQENQERFSELANKNRLPVPLNQQTYYPAFQNYANIHPSPQINFESMSGRIPHQQMKTYYNVLKGQESYLSQQNNQNLVNTSPIINQIPQASNNYIVQPVNYGTENQKAVYAPAGTQQITSSNSNQISSQKAGAVDSNAFSSFEINKKLEAYNPQQTIHQTYASASTSFPTYNHKQLSIQPAPIPQTLQINNIPPSNYLGVPHLQNPQNYNSNVQMTNYEIMTHLQNSNDYQPQQPKPDLSLRANEGYQPQQFRRDLPLQTGEGYQPQQFRSDLPLRAGEGYQHQQFRPDLSLQTSEGYQPQPARTDSNAFSNNYYARPYPYSNMYNREQFNANEQNILVG